MAEDGFPTVVSRRQYQMNMYAIFVISFITLSSAAYGYAAANIATTLTQPSFHEDMGLLNNPNASAIIGTINGKCPFQVAVAYISSESLVDISSWQAYTKLVPFLVPAWLDG